MRVVQNCSAILSNPVGSSTHPAPPNKKGLKDRPFLFGGEGGIIRACALTPSGPPWRALSPLRRCHGQLIRADENLGHEWRRGWDSNTHDQALRINNLQSFQRSPIPSKPLRPPVLPVDSASSGKPTFLEPAPGLVVTTILLKSRRAMPDGQISKGEFAISSLWQNRPEGWRVIYSHESTTH